MHLTVEGPSDGAFRWTVIIDEHREGLDLDDALAQMLDQTADGAIRLWLREVDAPADTAVTNAGFVQYRDLWQLRCPLPNAPSGLSTRAFTDADLEDFVGVNNRAFHWHPEQSGLTPDAARDTMTEDWFDPDGFRLLHEDHTLIGFCWTKVHQETEPPLGEIYVIAIDPSRHGRGLGKPMTLAGLEWLSAQGLRHGMLYVESDNDAANATYEALGFRRHHIDRAYRLSR